MHRPSIVLCITILVLIFTSSSLTAQNGQVELLLIGTDLVDDTSNYDISAVWVGHTADELVFVIRSFNLSDPSNPPIYLPIQLTIKTENGDLYLVEAKYNTDGDTLVLSQADNLNQEPSNTNTTFTQPYLSDRLFFNPHLGEIGFSIDWLDIGGQQRIQFVIWGFDNNDAMVDRYPNNIHAEYELHVDGDRQLDFAAAIAGNFETLDPVQDQPEYMRSTTPISSEPSQSTITSYDEPVVTENEGIPVVLFLIIAVLIGLYMLRGRIFPSESYRPEKEPLNSMYKYDQTYPKTPIDQNTALLTRREPSQMQMKFIPEIGREMRMCCYQTARLNEAYCWCGRAVDEETRKLFETES